MTPQPEREDVKDAVVSSTVIAPPAHSVEIGNPTRNPKDGMCNWCRNVRGDIYCDTFPICFDCLEILIDRENAIAMAPNFRHDKYFDALTPWGWERD